MSGVPRTTFAYGLSQKFCNEPEALATDEPWKIRRLRFRRVRRLLQSYCDGPCC